jgi:predicted nuclease with TOPRIM domain
MSIVEELQQDPELVAKLLADYGQMSLSFLAYQVKEVRQESDDHARKYRTSVNEFRDQLRAAIRRFESSDVGQVERQMEHLQQENSDLREALRLQKGRIDNIGRWLSEKYPADFKKGEG